MLRTHWNLRRLKDGIHPLDSSSRGSSSFNSGIDRRGKIQESFEVSAEVMADLKRFIMDSGLLVPAQSWQSGMPYLRVRVRTELMNLTY